MEPTVDQSRWTLRFRDPELERAYADHLSTQVRRQVLAVFVVMAMVWLSAAPLDRVVAGSPGNGTVLLALRLGLGTPLLTSAILIYALASPHRYLAWRISVTLAGSLSLTASFVLMGILVPDPHLIPMGAAIEGWIVGGFAFALLYGLPFSLSAPTLLVSVTMLLAIGTIRGTRLTPSDAFNAVASVALDAVGAYLLEASRRANFLALRAEARERTRADGLLENMMPHSIAARLKDGERSIAEHFDAATVLFADLVGFTRLTERLSPSALVETLDTLFTVFDELAERHGLEKVKTIGDAYMVVGGVPDPRADHASAVAAMALEMVEAVAKLGGGLAVRIGIHTGPVVADVIGTKKFAYDLWGDTVNVASRMESHGLPGSIQVSAPTAEALEAAFVLEPRGVVDIKGKGELSAFWLRGARATSVPVET